MTDVMLEAISERLPWEEEVAHDLVALADDNIEDFLVRKKKR